MGFFLRVSGEDMQRAIESHSYKPGYQSIEHAESQVEPGESYQIYQDGEIDTDGDNKFETVNGKQYQLVKSGTK